MVFLRCRGDFYLVDYMYCCFPSLAQLSNTFVNFPFEPYDPRPLHISIYSATKLQTFTCVTIIVLSTLVLLVGASSISGANIINNKTAWAMIGTGGAGIGGALIYRMYIHVSFLREVNRMIDLVEEYLIDSKSYNAANTFSVNSQYITLGAYAHCWTYRKVVDKEGKIQHMCVDFFNLKKVLVEQHPEFANRV